MTDRSTSLPFAQYNPELLYHIIDADLSKTAERTLLYYMLNVDIKSGKIHKIPYKRIATILNRSVSAVYRAIAELEEKGFIQLDDDNALSARLTHSAGITASVKNARKGKKSCKPRRRNA